MKKTEATKPTKQARDSSRDLGKLLVQDVMRRDLLTLRADDTVEQGIQLLEEYHITGAPVVDGTGTPVGVFSVRDVARGEHLDDMRTDRGSQRSYGSTTDESPEEGAEREIYAREDYSPEVLGRARIADWMSAGFVSIDPSATLADACRRMVEDSIHRIFVVENGRAVGVVSAWDLVRLIAAEE